MTLQQETKHPTTVLHPMGRDGAHAGTGSRLTTPRRRWIAIGVALAIIAAGCMVLIAARSTGSSTATPSGPTLTDTTIIDTRPLVPYAQVNGLTGLSPASLGPAPGSESRTDYAMRHHLTGLSPASLGPAGAAALAEYARRNHLTGLSPASLGAVTDPERAEN